MCINNSLQLLIYCYPLFILFIFFTYIFKKNGSFAERVYKVIFVGDSGVGKSSIIRKFVSGVFDLNLPLTVAIDFHVKFMHCDGTNLYLQLWDTAGQEK